MDEAFFFEALVRCGFAKVADDGEITVFIGKDPKEEADD